MLVQPPLPPRPPLLPPLLLDEPPEEPELDDEPPEEPELDDEPPEEPELDDEPPDELAVGAAVGLQVPLKQVDMVLKFPATVRPRTLTASTMPPTSVTSRAYSTAEAPRSSRSRAMMRTTYLPLVERVVAPGTATSAP